MHTILYVLQGLLKFSMWRNLHEVHVIIIIIIVLEVMCVGCTYRVIVRCCQFRTGWVGLENWFLTLGWWVQHLVNYGILRMWSAEFRGDYVTWCVGTHDPWVRQFSSLWCFFCFHHNSWLVLLLLEKITIHYWLTDCAITTTSMVLRWMGSIVWYAFGSIPSWDSSQICNSLQAEKEHKLNHVR